MATLCEQSCPAATPAPPGGDDFGPLNPVSPPSAPVFGPVGGPGQVLQGDLSPAPPAQASPGELLI